MELDAFTLSREGMKMKFKNRVSLLVLFIVVLSTAATLTGIFSSQGPGPYEYQSIRDQTVIIYGKGIYQHMSAEVAPQGIAQDVVTLGIGIPLLVLSLYLSRKGLFRGRLWLAGSLGYFLVTYTFYMMMGMYNQLFLVYVLLASTSFFAFTLTMLSFDLKNLSIYFGKKQPVWLVGGFLIFNAVAISLLWLGIIVPPFIKGAIPLEVEHYTTLVVQGIDLAFLLPISFLSGILIIKRTTLGYLLASVYINFLVLLMTALTAKVIGMMLMGGNVGPPIFIIPLFNVITILCSVLNLIKIKEEEYRQDSIQINGIS